MQLHKKSPVFVLWVLVVTTSFWVACQQRTSRSTELTPNVTDTLSMLVAPTLLYFDSADLHAFLLAHPELKTFEKAYADFYGRHKYQYVWYTNRGITETAFGLASHTAVIFNEKGLYLPYAALLDSLLHTDNEASSQHGYKPHLQTELLLTGMYFNYAKKILQGVDESMSVKMGWLLPRRKLNISFLLDSFLVAKDWDSFEKNSLNEQYFRLRTALHYYKSLTKTTEAIPIELLPKKNAKLRLGDSAVIVPMLTTRLKELGFVSPAYNGTDTRIDSALRAGIALARNSYGLQQDSSVDNSLIKELNVPAAERIKTLLVNMERLRWIPAQIDASQLLFVNIPDFKLIHIKQGKPIWECKVVVGTPVHRTVIFSGIMDYVVFSPYWYVPQSIINNEIGLERAKSAAYLKRKNMEWVGGSLREKPGPNNSLGRVKFIFPNSNSIYLHDTPAKALFSRESRAFSHGCIRVAEPFELAKRVLAADSSWTEDRIKTAMNANKEQKVILKEKIPVYIGYFTAFADSTGRVHFRKDIYGRDKELLEALAGKQ